MKQVDRITEMAHALAALCLAISGCAALLLVVHLVRLATTRRQPDFHLTQVYVDKVLVVREPPPEIEEGTDT